MPTVETDGKTLIVVVVVVVVSVIALGALMHFYRSRKRSRQPVPIWMTRIDYYLHSWKRRSNWVRTSSGSSSDVSVTSLCCAKCSITRTPTLSSTSACMAAVAPQSVEARAMQQRKWLLSKGVEHFVDFFKSTQQVPCVLCGQFFVPPKGVFSQVRDVRDALQHFLDERDANLAEVERRARVESLV